jgi:predicted enzyme related to lactoylglutathione lyase
VSLRIDSLLVDCADASRIATFWSAALGWKLTGVSEDQSDAELVEPTNPRRRILFQKVPEGKTAKNRLHLDLRPSRTRDEEVDRLRELGATVLEGFGGPAATWTVMQDPEGNEFCVLRGPEDPVPPGGQPVEF